MGLSPNLYSVIGFTDAVYRDPRLVRKVKGDPWETQVTPIHKVELALHDGEMPLWADVIYNPLGSTGGDRYVKGVVGYILGETDSEVAYALYQAFPEIFETGGGYNYRILPKRELRYDEKMTLARGNERDKAQLRQAMRYGWLTAHTGVLNSWSEFTVGKSMLRRFGWNVGFKDLKRLLVWNWE